MPAKPITLNICRKKPLISQSLPNVSFAGLSGHKTNIATRSPEARGLVQADEINQISNFPLSCRNVSTGWRLPIYDASNHPGAGLFHSGNKLLFRRTIALLTHLAASNLNLRKLVTIPAITESRGTAEAELIDPNDRTVPPPRWMLVYEDIRTAARVLTLGHY